MTCVSLSWGEDEASWDDAVRLLPLPLNLTVTLPQLQPPSATAHASVHTC